MEKNKNILIGGLLAIVLIMAVGYAAFATQLTVNGTAEITSKWDVHFKEDNTTMTATTTGVGDKPTGTMTRTSATAYTVTADLKQPGDKIVYTFTVENAGTLAATLQQSSDDTTGTPAISSNGNDYIKFSVSPFSTTNLAANTGTATFTLTAEYVDAGTNGTSATLSDDQKTATTTVTFNALQA